MTLTKIQLRRAARAARDLAYRFAENRGPKLSNFGWCNCLAGRVARNARLPNADLGTAGAELDSFGSYLPSYMLTEATQRHCAGERGAVVFPLLALGDALENATKSPSKNLPEEA